MTNETVRIPKDVLLNMSNALHSPFHDFEWEGLKVHVVATLELKEMLGFVADVVESCFDEKGDYIPEIYDFAIKRGLATRYANLDLPEKVEDQYKILFLTNICYQILDLIDRSQFNEIVRAIDRKLKSLSEASTLQAHNEIQRIATVFTTLQGDLDSAMEKLSNIDIPELVHKMEGITEKGIVSSYLEQKKVEGTPAEAGE